MRSPDRPLRVVLADDNVLLREGVAGLLDRAGIEARGTGPLEPALESAARIADRPALARALGGTLRADVDVLNNTQLHTSNLFGLWVAQDLDEEKLRALGRGRTRRAGSTDPFAALAAVDRARRCL